VHQGVSAALRESLSILRSNARPLALVTGASSGIGEALARELARDQHDLVLVARRFEALRTLADELKGFGTQCTIIPTDLGRSGAAAGLADDLKARGLIIEVLINAAGFGANGPFESSDATRNTGMLQVNVVAVTELTRFLLPDMVARRRGRIMLVASTAAFQPGPQMAVYSASKAYVLSFGEASAFELRGSGVTVTTLCPGATATEFAKTADVEASALFRGSMVMSAADVARIGYRGLKAGRRVVITGLFNNIMARSSRLSPSGMTMAIANRLMSSPKEK
jgi:short-subunit dehydrogenase